eukprot:Em0011g997a
MSVCRSTVMMLLAVMDPEGTRQRKMHRRLQRRTYENMGPNWCWHMDGYDKLKPYGFPIHACIDGFSRKIIWLELSTTNNDPGVVAQYYLTAVFQLGGSGTFGVVVKGVYLGTEVAIKMIKMDDDMNLKTHLEVQIMRQLRHPNIITLMGISSNKSELLIVMNLVNGFNVDQVIFKQALPLDTNTVRSIAVQITKALTYMHGRSPRVIHHDIKPSNIMVTGSHHVFVCDLGLARLQNHLATIKTSKGCGAGTVPYKAPEMFYDGKRSTPADIYSFGCVLIELTTSRRVWGTMDGFQITAKKHGLAHIPQRVLGQQPQENLATVVHWFRIDSLRLHDNPAFNYAVTSGLRFKAIFIVDPWFNASYNNGPSVNVWRFYLESLHDLNDKLQKRPYQTRLNVFVGQPTAILPALFSRWNVSKLTFQASQVSYESKQHDEIIQRMATEHSVECVSFFAHTLYNPNDILTCNNGRVPVSYKEFRRLLPIVGCPQEPIPEPNPLSLLLSYVAPGTSIAEGEIPTLQSLGFAPNEKLYTNHWVGERLKH